MPHTYVNGLPDLFEAHHKAHQSFKWFKKERKSFREHGGHIINLMP